MTPKRSAIVSSIANTLIAAHTLPPCARATPLLTIADSVTATGTGAGQTLNLNATGLSNPLISPTIAYSFGDAFNGLGQSLTGSDFNLGGSGSPWNFQDDYTFTTTGAI